MRHILSPLFLASSLLLLNGCGDSSNNNGQLSLSLIDGPIDSAEAVVVQFSGIALKPAGGSEIEINFEQPKSIDLLQQQNGNSAALLDDFELEAGRYNWIRLMVNADADPLTDDTYITIAGVKHALDIPSGSQTGLKLVSGFDVDAGGESHFTIDFDLRKSIVHNQQGYKLKPALRLIDNSQAGHIAGEVDGTVLSSNNCGVTDSVAAAIYVFSGNSVTPDDVGSSNPPVATSNVVYSAGDGKYRYSVAYLAAGDYTVALTCDAVNDDAEADNNISFINPQNASVTIGTTQTVNF